MAKIERLRSRAAGCYRMAKRGDRAEIFIYGPIGSSFFEESVSAKQFARDLRGLKDVTAIDLRMNSEGGDVFEGQAIYTLLQDHQAEITVHIDGVAASAASFIAMAGDRIKIAESAFVMIHNAWAVALGDGDEFRRMADLLDNVNGVIRDKYAARTGQNPETVAEMMAAETWMNGPEAVERGFADEVVENLQVAATIRDPSRFRNLPAALRPRRVAAMSKIATLRDSLKSLSAR